MSKLAHILALDTSSIGVTGFGITGERKVIDGILKRSIVWVGPRPLLEMDARFVQPIPYIVLRKGDKVLAYKRANAGNEARLHDKISVGLGGHVDVADVVIDDNGAIALLETLVVSAARELEEEVDLSLPTASEVDSETAAAIWDITHVIQSQATPVDAVHIGFVIVIDTGMLAAHDFTFEDAIANAEWETPQSLLDRNAAGTLNLEGWTEMVLRTLLPA